MTRVEKSIRSRLAVSVVMTLLGIACAIYGQETVGAAASIFGMGLLVFNVHRIGRMGSDA